MDKFRHLFGTPDPKAMASRIRWRRALVSSIFNKIPYFRLALFFVGYAWMIFIPLPLLGQQIYIDENALQPSQVNTYWDWADVHRADRYLEKLESLRDSNATSKQRASFIKAEFQELGIPAATQDYTYNATTGFENGSNAYAFFSSPKTSSAEAMVISASWLSRTGEVDTKYNLRGVSTVLALANLLTRYSHWAKDLIFVISDGHLEGMHAFLSTYHGESQPNLEVEPLALSSGVVWTALNIDYPGHSFSHLGIFFEGLNGRLPNQDLLNAFHYISRQTGGTAVVLYDHIPSQHQLKRPMFSWIPKVILNSRTVWEYSYRAKNILRHIGFEARGRPSGVHGLFHQFRIDAITLFAVPARGPHGFYAIGRIVESTLRSTNNLLERLHASFFFYLMMSPEIFLKIGYFLPSVALISAAMMFGGLWLWVDSGWSLSETVPSHATDKDGPAIVRKWLRRRRPVLPILGIMIATHSLGLVLFCLANRPWVIDNRKITFPLLFSILGIVPLAIPFAMQVPETGSAPLPQLLHALNLCLASTVISILTVLNFSLAAATSVLLGLPLSFAHASGHPWLRIIKYILYVFLGFGWLMIGHEEVRDAIWYWEILRGWFAPFMCIVYGPLALQAGIVSLLK